MTTDPTPADEDPVHDYPYTLDGYSRPEIWTICQLAKSAHPVRVADLATKMRKNPLLVNRILRGLWRDDIAEPTSTVGAKRDHWKLTRTGIRVHTQLTTDSAPADDDPVHDYPYKLDGRSRPQLWTICQLAKAAHPVRVVDLAKKMDKPPSLLSPTLYALWRADIAEPTSTVGTKRDHWKLTRTGIRTHKNLAQKLATRRQRHSRPKLRAISPNLSP